MRLKKLVSGDKTGKGGGFFFWCDGDFNPVGGPFWMTSIRTIFGSFSRYQLARVDLDWSGRTIFCIVGISAHHDWDASSHSTRFAWHVLLGTFCSWYQMRLSTGGTGPSLLMFLFHSLNPLALSMVMHGDLWDWFEGWRRASLRGCSPLAQGRGGQWTSGWLFVSQLPLPLVGPALP